MLKEFEVGKKYRVMGYEELSQCPEVKINPRGSLIYKSDSDMYTIKMDRYVKDMIFKCDEDFNVNGDSIYDYFIEPWMCEEVTDTLTKVDKYKPLKQALKTLSNYCNDSECGDCPMADLDGKCLILLNSPCNWNIINRVQILK